MADLLATLTNPLFMVGGMGLFLIAGALVGLVMFRDKIRFLLIKILRRYPINCYIFELRANTPIPIGRFGAIKLPQEDGQYDVLRLETGEKVRVFGYKNIYNDNGKPIMFLLRVGQYEFHVIDIELHETIGIPEFDENGKPIYEQREVQELGVDGQPLFDDENNPVTAVKDVPKLRAVQKVLFRPRIDEDAMAWIIREMRRAEQRRRDRSVWGTIFPLLAPLLLCIGLMLLLKGTLDPLLQLTQQLGPDLRALTAALNNVAIISAGPKPPV